VAGEAGRAGFIQQTGCLLLRFIHNYCCWLHRVKMHLGTKFPPNQTPLQADTYRYKPSFQAVTERFP
jgi:hypothetical protein